MRKCLLAVVLVLGLSSSIGSRGDEVSDSVHVVRYLLEWAHNKQFLAQLLVDATKDEPELRELVMDAFDEGYRYDEFALRFSSVLEEHLSPAETQQCMIFIESEHGRAMMESSRAASSPDDVLQRMALMPAADRKAAEGFLGEACFKKTIAAMASSEGQQASSKYGTDLMCRHVARAEPSKYAAVRTRCLTQ